uniref:AlNc14C60G4403 protein n=1 Tax=Albugo laibachii Nc14 TaxID=890382 RepID=F0WCL9_9STRA|nr:AlNc14C60G4403 [Albugo laibachii Nc14]|eukprot:CCA18940.1 AlNc14C60G4403 [Albugo laibachii Nc14]
MKTLFSTYEAFLSAPLKQKKMEGEIKRMRGHSSPGMDGLPAALYQLAPGIFGECLQIGFADQLRRGSLLRSQRSSDITFPYNKRAPCRSQQLSPHCFDVRGCESAVEGTRVPTPASASKVDTRGSKSLSARTFHPPSQPLHE